MTTAAAFRILVAIDFSPASLCSLDHALAWALRTRCELHLLHVVDRGGLTIARGELAHDFVELGRVVDVRLRRLAPDPRLAQRVAAVERHVVGGDPAAEIVAAAERLGVDLVVMGRDGEGVEAGAPLLGSTADAVRRAATCPVLFVAAGDAPAQPPAVRRVVCPLDVAPCSRCAAFTAARIARLHGAELVLLHVLSAGAPGSPPDVERLLAELRRDVELAGELDVRTALARGAAAIDVASRLRADDGELLIAGSRGEGGEELAGRHDALADEIVRAARCPIVAVPAPERASCAADAVRFDADTALLVVDLHEALADPDAARVDALVRPVNELVRTAVAHGALVVYDRDDGELVAGLRVCGPVLRGEEPAEIARFLHDRHVARVVLVGIASAARIDEIAREAQRLGCGAELVPGGAPPA